MKRLLLLLIAVCVLSIATGCWDRQLLKNTRLVYGISLDKVQNNHLLTTVSIRSSTSSHGGPSSPTNDIVSSRGATIHEARRSIGRKISGPFSASKIQFVLLGNELAKDNIYGLLDIFYRDPRSQLGARVAVVDGRAEDIIKLKTKEETLIDEYVWQLIKTEERNTTIPASTIQTICSNMFDPGHDFALPQLRTSPGKKRVELAGTALFHGKQFSGITLSPSDSTLLLLLADQKKKFAHFTKKVKNSKKETPFDYVTFNAKKVKVRMNIDTNQTPLKVSIHLNIKAVINEYPSDRINRKGREKALGKKLTAQLTEQANALMTKLQKANCDYFGIGRELMAYHPDTWKKLRWETAYRNIRLEPKVNVDIIGYGIID